MSMLSIYDFSTPSHLGQSVMVDDALHCLNMAAARMEDYGVTVCVEPSIEYLVWSRMPCHDVPLSDTSTQEGT